MLAKLRTAGKRAGEAPHEAPHRRSWTFSAFGLPLAIFMLLLLATMAWAGPERDQDKITRQYGQAKAYYQELLASGKCKTRKSWLTSVTAFRSIYKAAPKHQVAPKALFMLGQIYQTMFQQSGKTKDLDQSIASYEELSTKYAGNVLADDAFFILGDRKSVV